ncbi:unnamed protein product [Rotaria sp. Silwood1]|nr:unnamed protein product [Rotaria sp. Silwood1]
MTGNASLNGSIVIMRYSRIFRGDKIIYIVAEDSASFLPKISVQPIGYSEAEIFLQYLRDDEVDAQWHGGLRNVTYRYGGELRDAS